MDLAIIFYCTKTHDVPVSSSTCVQCYVVKLSIIFLVRTFTLFTKFDRSRIFYGATSRPVQHKRRILRKDTSYVDPKNSMNNV
jgi:hypothetical protein